VAATREGAGLTVVPPRVSIVLAVRNQARWLPATLASVRAQTFTDWELVVVDDGSSDATATVARATDDARVRVVSTERRERAAARNRGLAETTAPLVAFLDGDDLWHPEKLARQMAPFDARADVALCYTIARYVDADDRPLDVRRPPHPVEGAVFPALLRANLMILSSVMIRRAALDAVGGGFDERLPVLGCEDWDLWLRIARRFPVAVVPEELTRYRRHDGNTTSAQLLASGLLVAGKHYRDPETPAAARLSRSAAFARLYWYHAGAAAGRARAIALAARAVAAAPASVFSRPALGALATIALPRAVRRLLP
jgi:glycosyltransferase involved in cell wall biosynthesis